ncbi:MAG: LysM peptidoglycan-binding domain-containing protein [Anaerolineae bacterium]|jgi:LysM repeat protein|nr:LysM peptidoglycan-binding domain-containing protein [Anaerolineae bacterium]
MQRLKIILAAALLVVPALLPAPAALAAGSCARTHTVVAGETLSRIARRYETSVSVLQSLNGLRNPNRIFAGQSLCVQEQITTSIRYTVQRGDTLARIARAHGVNLQVLARVNNLADMNRIYVGQVLLIPEVTIQ